MRLDAAHLFEQDVSPVQVAQQLRVGTKSAYQWRRRWRAGGEAALASKGPGGTACRLNTGQLARLRAALDGGPAAWGWGEDQRWTLARVTTLIGRLFHVRYTLRDASYLLHRMGYTRRFLSTGLPGRMSGPSPRGRPRPGSSFEAGGGDPGRICASRTRQGRTFARPKPAPGHRAATPVVQVPGRGSGWVSVAGLACYKPGERSRFFYRARTHRGCKGERRSMSDPATPLVTAAHNQLHAPVILIWDNLNTHLSATMRAFIHAHPDWLTEARLPAYAPTSTPSRVPGRT